MTRTKEKEKEKELTDSIAQWAAGNPRIRRVWLFRNGSRRKQRGNGPIEVALELEPAFDSEETLAAWMAHGGLWRSQLQRRVSAPLDLEWFDPDGSTALDDAKVLVYERTG